MEWQLSPYTPPLIAVGFITFVTAVYTYRQRHVFGATNLLVMLLSITIWIWTYAVELSAITLSAKLFWAKVQWTGVFYIPVGYFLFVLKYTGDIWALKKPRQFAYALLVIPLFTLLLAWTSTWHPLIWDATQLVTHQGNVYLHLSYGFGYWVFVAYVYLLLVSGTILLLRKIMATSPQFKGQMILILVSTFFPWLGNFTYITRTNPLPYLDPTPFTFAISILCLAWALFYFNFLNVVPIARDLVMEELETGVLVLDRQNRVVDINATAVSLLKKEKKALLGKTLILDQPQWTSLATALQESHSAKIEMGLNQAHYEVSVTVLDKRKNKASGRLITLHNITTRKETEHLLQRAKEAAEAASQAKTHFLTNMSHEIRTPLNAVVGMTEMLRQTPLNDNQSEMLNVVSNSSNHLVLLINNILDFAKLEAGNLTLNHQSFDLNDCLESASDSVSQAAHKKHLQLTYYLDEQTPTWLVGDPVRLRQILINLLENSIKFTQEGKIELAVTHSMAAGNVMLEFTVRDSGIGIDPGQIQQLFSPFQQADSSMTRAYGGSGLGLVICQRLVAMMGGDIHLHSEPGQGTAVHFTARFNVATEAHPPAVTLSQHNTTLALKRLLVITKDAIERRHISKEARVAGLEVYAAGSVQEAAYWINHSQPFDAVLLDTAVWQEDPAILEHLHHKESQKPLPVVLLVPADSNPLLTPNPFSGTLHTPVVSSHLYDVLLNVLSTSEAQTFSEGQGQTMAARYPFNILIVEDNDVNRRVLKNMLDKLGYQADVASNGQIAVQAAAQKKYDVILMDIQMPVMDGVEATRHILANCPAAERPYIITVTAHALEGDREYYLSVGMNEYVSKPITMNKLVEVLYQAVKYHAPLAAAPEPDTILESTTEPATILTSINTIDTIDTNGILEQSIVPPSPIDLAELAQLVGENTSEFLQLMTPIFLEDTQQVLQKLADAVQSQDSLEIRHAAHTLKGSSASMAMTKLSEFCRELETMAKENELADTPQKLEQIRAEFSRVEAALAEMVETAV